MTIFGNSLRALFTALLVYSKEILDGCLICRNKHFKDLSSSDGWRMLSMLLLLGMVLRCTLLLGSAGSPQ
jgi:hypothetical protein